MVAILVTGMLTLFFGRLNGLVFEALVIQKPLINVSTVLLLVSSLAVHGM